MYDWPRSQKALMTNRITIFSIQQEHEQTYFSGFFSGFSFYPFSLKSTQNNQVWNIMTVLITFFFTDTDTLSHLAYILEYFIHYFITIGPLRLSYWVFLVSEVMNIAIKSWLKAVHGQMVLISSKHLVANSTFSLLALTILWPWSKNFLIELLVAIYMRR